MRIGLLICFGEAFPQGFYSLFWNYDIDKNMAVEMDSPTIRQLAEFKMTYGVALMTGYIEKEQNSLPDSGKGSIGVREFSFPHTTMNVYAHATREAKKESANRSERDTHYKIECPFLRI